MRASTLFAVALAIFLGLGVVAAAKYSGIFNPRPKEMPPPKEHLKVLVAAKNLFEGYTILHGDVRVRDMSDEEEKQYLEHKDHYLPAKVEAGEMRVLVRSVEADQPLLREYLEDINLPKALNLRLSSDKMRAVTLSLPVSRTAGGQIQKGEHVDVYLTTIVNVPGRTDGSITQTAAIARNLKVIVKRNLWPILAPVDATKPIDYILEANPYRAALIEFARTKGELSLLPTATPQESNGKTGRSVVPPTQSDPSSKEYVDEDKRIAEFVSGERSVGEADLERIFNLKPIRLPVQIEKYYGVDYHGTQTFATNGMSRPTTAEPAYGYQFSPPPPPAANPQ
jgi:Flp pilus assembly protein CpaB